MSSGEEKQGALVPAPSSSMTRVGAKSLVARGRDLLRQKEVAAAEWLRKGLELWDEAPEDPRVTALINPYAIQPSIPDLCAQLQTAVRYISQVLAGSDADAAARSLGMTPDDLEIAHVAYFFMPATLAVVMGESAAWVGERVEDHDHGTGPTVPSPAGMDDGVLTQRTVELSVQIAFELEKIQQQVRKRGEALEEAFRCFETGHELDSWNPELLYWLANAYWQGAGILEDEEKAVSLYQLAAERGHAKAQIAIGDAHAQCGFTSLPKNKGEAARWYRVAAEQGEEVALCMVVDMYQRGEGVKQDHAEAARLLRNAVTRGDETALHNLRLYAKKYGLPYEESDAG